MYVVRDPAQYDTIVTSNMFGDIFTDLAAMIQGGLGIAASGNIHPGQVSLFEPIHGSAPKHAGKNVANPIATIIAVPMMLDWLGGWRSERVAPCFEGGGRSRRRGGGATALEAGAVRSARRRSRPATGSVRPSGRTRARSGRARCRCTRASRRAPPPPHPPQRP